LIGPFIFLALVFFVIRKKRVFFFFFIIFAAGDIWDQVADSSALVLPWTPFGVLVLILILVLVLGFCRIVFVKIAEDFFCGREGAKEKN
jgi:hypothetical protein